MNKKHLKSNPMIGNHFRITWRQLWKNKAISLINMGGLSIGIACSVLLLSYVAFHLSYDGWHAQKQDIYRVGLDFYQDSRLVIESAETYSAVGPALKKDFPEVLGAARLYNMGYKNNCVFSYNNTYFRETHFLYAEPSFLTMFTFPLVQGDAASALAQPYTAVISESTARKLFGAGYLRTALGRSIQMTDDDRNAELCRITGIVKDIPENSHLKFNILISWSTLQRRNGGPERFEQNWDKKDFYTYVLLRPGTDPATLERKLSAFTRLHIPGEQAQHQQSILSLQPLEKIHLSSGRLDEPETTIHAKAITFLTIIAFFIVTIAWINYINLATAGSTNRAREVGIRKVLGSRRAQLIRQFFIESFCMNAISFVLAMMLINAINPLLHRIFAIDFPISVIFRSTYGLIFLVFLLLGAFFSGLYPALILSSFKPVAVLKGKIASSAKGLMLRKTLVVFQFSLSILLIIGTLVVHRQVQYMLHRDIGIHPSQIMVLDRPGRWDTARSTHNLLVKRFKEALKNDPSVEAIAMSDELPGKEIRWPTPYAALKNGLSSTHSIPINTTVIDQDYIPTLGMTVLAGRNFSDAFKTDRRGLILTASAAKLLGFSHATEAIGKEFRADDGDYTVVGVVNDFHQLSLQQKAAPAAFQFNGGDLREYEYYLVKLKTNNIHQAVDRVQSVWAGSFKGNPFAFSFLDDYFNRQYQHDIQFGVLFGTFSFLAIIIACIGLVALVAFMIRQRTREIGIRKILGASVQEILFQLTKDFIKLVLLANLLAWPLGWFLMNNWLKDFAYRIHIHWSVFILAGFTAFAIALLTISFQALKAALTNPIESLRTD